MPNTNSQSMPTFICTLCDERFESDATHLANASEVIAHVQTAHLGEPAPIRRVADPVPAPDDNTGDESP